MSHWWLDTLYDTNSLISLHAIYQDHPDMERFFPSPCTIRHVLGSDGLKEETRVWFGERIALVDVPDPMTLCRILPRAGLPRSLAGLDSLLFATAVHQDMKVMTGDRLLGRELRSRGLLGGNVALALRDLVSSEEISVVKCEKLLGDLFNRGEFILGNLKPTWSTLVDYRFP